MLETNFLQNLSSMDRAILAELIRGNKRLIIPNIGAFLHRETDNASQLGITFSPFLKYNDGQLEELLVNSYGFTKIKASERVKKLSSEIFEEINDKGAYAIPGIGSLVLDSKGSITLISTDESVDTKESDSKNLSSSPKNDEVLPTKNANKLDDFSEKQSPEGIPSTANTKGSPNSEHYTEIAPGVERVNTNALHSILIEKSPDRIEEDIPAKEEQTKTDMKKNHKGNGNKPPMVKVAVFVIVSLTVILVFSFIVRELAFLPDDTDWESAKSKNENVEPIKLPNEFQSKTDPLDKKFESTNPDNEKSSQESNTQPKTENTEEIIEKAMTGNATKGSQSAVFSLVLGSFSEKVNAQKYIEELQAKGLKAEIYSKPNGKHLVVLGQYKSKDEANIQKEKIKNQFQGIWIISREQ